MNEETSGALSGGMSGAASGARTGNPYAAIAGAIVGTVGGYFSGKKIKKAKKYAQKAAAIQQQREQEAYRQSLLAQIRQARITRASNLAAAVAAGTEEGSGAQAALSSIGSQIANVVEYMSVDRGRAVEQATYLARAQKNVQTAQKIQSLTSGSVDLIAGVGSAYETTKTPQVNQVQDTGRVQYGSGNMTNKNFTVVSNNTYGGTTPYVPYNK